MNSESTLDWQRIERLLDEVLDASLEQRAEVLNRHGATSLECDCIAAMLEGEHADGGRLNRLMGVLAHPVPIPRAGQRMGRWQLLELLGKGGMATVWLAERIDGEVKHQAAVKCLEPGMNPSGLRARFKQEQGFLARLEHPHIARLFDSGVADDGTPYIVMERVRGSVLTEWCRQHQATRAMRLTLFHQALNALMLAHGELIVHRDLKPANMLVDVHGQLKLLDFGIAGLVDGPVSGTDSHYRALTPEYAAPEQLAGEPAGVAADIYSMGRVLEELLADVMPRSKSSLCQIQAVIDKARATRPEDRYTSVAELKADLDRFSGFCPVTARPAGVGVRSRLFLRRQWLPVGVGLLVCAALGLGLVLALVQAERANTARATAEAAQERAEAINQFVIALFEGEIPMVPADELPSTRQIVDRGIALTRDPAGGPSEMRAAFQLTLSSILLARRQFEDARELLQLAQDMLSAGTGNSNIEVSDLRARALMLDASIYRAQRDFDAEAERLDEAVRLLADYDPGGAEHLTAQVQRAFVDLRMERLDMAQTRYEAILSQPSDLRKHGWLYRDVLRQLGLLAARREDVATAEHYFRRSLEMVLADSSADLTSRTGALHDMASTLMAQGRFAEARVTLEQILDLLSPLADRPTQVQAATWFELSRIARYEARFNDALVAIEASAEHWRQVLNQTSVDESFFIHYQRGLILSDADRLSEAISSLSQALTLMRSDPEVPVQRIAEVEAILSGLECRQGDLVNAESRLNSLSMSDLGRFGAALSEAHGWCLLNGLSLDVGPADLLATLETVPGALPGLGVEQARRGLLRARLYLRENDVSAARDAVAEARARLKITDASHPLFAMADRIESTFRP